MHYRKLTNLGKSYEISGSADFFAIAGKNTVSVWSLSELCKLDEIKVFSNPSYLDFLPNDSRTILVKNTSGSLGLVDLVTHSFTTLLRKKNDEGSEIFYLNLGSQFIEGSWSGKLTIRDCGSMDIIFEENYPNEMINRITTNN